MEWGWQRYQVGGKLFAAQMCDDAYQLVFQKRTKKLQKQILEEHL